MIQSGNRVMAWVSRIDDVRSIPEASNICQYRIGGWWVVDQINRFVVGDSAIYVAIDSWVPSHIAAFLSKGNPPREFQGILGERLRTIKLRGALSQGLLLSVDRVDDQTIRFQNFEIPDREGFDVSQILGIVKYEPPIPAQLAGDVVGLFPSFIPKTDQERIQNLTEQHRVWYDNRSITWEITEKLDGSSMTVFVCGDEQGVCSRNMNLAKNEANTFWAVAIREKFIDKIRHTGRNLALQFELIGQGIQGNKYRLADHQALLFDIYDIDQGVYLTPEQRRNMANSLGITHVPVVEKSVVIDLSVDLLLEKADGQSALNAQTKREGLVYKCNVEDGPSFKAISNKFLLHGGE